VCVFMYVCMCGFFNVCVWVCVCMCWFCNVCVCVCVFVGVLKCVGELVNVKCTLT
jgi:hypothetical protein